MTTTEHTPICPICGAAGEPVPFYGLQVGDTRPTPPDGDPSLSYVQPCASCGASLRITLCEPDGTIVFRVELEAGHDA